MMRKGDQMCTRKLTSSSLEKDDRSRAYLWWQTYLQYFKMTEKINLSKMTNSREILPQHSDYLELEDIVLDKMQSRNLRKQLQKKNETGSLLIYNLYALFHLQFTPKNTPHCRSDFSH